MFDENGSVIAEGIINPDGSREGKWVYYYSDGKVRSAGSFVNNRERVNGHIFLRTEIPPQEGLFRGGRYDDLWTWFYDNGSVKREEEYYNGVEEGMYTEYDTAGIVINKGSYFDGLREGEWFYNVGDYSEKGMYKSGEKDGKCIAYYPDGTLKYEGIFILGNPDGYHRFYYPNGLLKEENYYNMGIREKNWKKFDQYGNLLITITYRNDEEYRINGEKIDFPAGSNDISQQP
jgi:antitoxin component YwqK of YwqJK toxin-antitoxin module